MPGSQKPMVPRLTVLRRQRFGGYFATKAAIGIDAAYLWGLEHGKGYRESCQSIKRIEQVFGMPIRELLEMVPNPECSS